MIPALDQLIILPAVLPAMTAAFLVLALRHDLKRQRIVSIAVTVLLVGLAAVLATISSRVRASGPISSAPGRRPSASCSRLTACRR